jgi:thiosulfate/3-mercaptopyruvate sulfurtransferase
MMRRFDQTLPRRTALMLGIGAAVLLGGCGSRAVSSVPPQPLPDFPGNIDSPLLVSVDWLYEQLNNRTPNLLVLDLGDWPDYRGGHIPGAIHSYWQETIERDDLVYGVVLNQKGIDSDEATQAKRIDWLKRYGISNETTVIAYDHGDGRRAARIVWFLRFLGFSAGAALDGGVAAWKGGGYELTTHESSPPSLTGEPAVSPQNGFYLVTSQLQSALADPATALVDIRSNDERHDTIDDQYDLGVIPGSIWAPWTDFVADEYGRFIAPDAALAKLADYGITPDRRVILYGRFGTDPNQMWLLLKLLAYPQVEIYDRGWVEWSATSGLAVDPLP